nr:MAG TPA: hypothetical protein [Caudoviricetes sp.]
MPSSNRTVQKSHRPDQGRFRTIVQSERVQ